MKKISIFLFFIFMTNVYSQDKALDLKFKEKYNYLNNYTTESGLNYIITGSKKNNGDVNVSCYNKNFDLVYDKSYKSNFRGLGAFFGRGISTPNVYFKMDFAKESNYSWTKHDNLIFNEKGEQKLNTFDSTDKNKEFETAFRILAGNYECNFGYVLDKTKKKE